MSEKAQMATWNEKKLSSTIFEDCLRHDKATTGRVVILTKQLEIPANNEGSGWPKKVTSFMLTCLKSNKYHGMITAELKVSLPELSSLRERSIGAFFMAFYGSFLGEKVSKNR
jgi:hypothetical protein